MSLVTQFTKGLKGLKLKEVGPYSTKYAKEHLTYSQLRPRFQTSLDKYTDKYIDTGSVTPLIHLMWATFFVSYAISWPKEYRHMKREQEAKLKGEDGHH